MEKVRAALRSTRVRAGAALLLLLGLVTVTPMFTGAASAHRAHLEASAECDGTVTWTATSWSKSDDGENRDVRVYRSSDDGEQQEVGHGSFSSADGYAFSGHFTWPQGATKVVVRSEPKSEWGNGDDPDEDGHDEVELEKPDCEDDGHVEHEVECEDHAPGYGDGTVTIHLSNPGPFGHEMEYDVHDPVGDDDESYTVASGDRHDVTYRGLEDGHHHIEIHEGDHDESIDVEVNCDTEVPSVTITQACIGGDGSVTVNLSNTGGEAVTFTVRHPVTGAAEQVLVAAGASAARSFAGLADGTYTIPVTTAEADLTQRVQVHCDGVGEEPPQCEVGDDEGDTTSTTVHEDDATSTSMEDHTSSTEDGHTSSTEDEGHTSSTEDGHTSSSVKGEGSSTSAYTGSSSSSSSSSTSLASRYGSSSSSSSSSSSVPAPSSSASSSSSAPSTTYGDQDDDDHDGTSTSVDEDDDDHEGTSTTVEGDDDGEHDCVPGEGRIEVAKACVDQDGQITITLVAIGDEVEFVVEGHTYEVEPGTPQTVVLGGLLDGPHVIQVMAGEQDLSFLTEVRCDVSPKVTVGQQCVGFDGTVTFLLENLGDDVAATFTVQGTDHVVAPGASEVVTFDSLDDGTYTFTLSINGQAQPDLSVTVDCNPDFDVVAQCNAVSATGTVDVYWFTITNTEDTTVDVTWDGGSVLVPAAESRTVGSLSAPLVLSVGGEVVATAAATDVVCSRTVVVDKELIGGPASPETYTVTISRLVGDTYVPVTAVPLVAGEPTTVTLPSTLDPAGVTYLVEETDQGSASTSTVSPSALTLSGHLGEMVSVVVTNGYASVLIDKSVDVSEVGLGGRLTYTLQGRNTGGLTLDPVVVVDRLPDAVAFVSASVAGNAGVCTLTEGSRPQLITCDLVGSLASGGSTPAITVVVDVDPDEALVGTTLTNQAKIVGAFAPSASIAAAVAPSSALSCEPVVDGTVCDLSAAVSTPVVGSEPPTTTSPPDVGGPTTTVPGGGTTTIPPDVLGPTTTVPGDIPKGGSDVVGMLTFAVGATGLGGLLLISRRRRRPA